MPVDAERSLERGAVLLNKISSIVVLEQTAATLISRSSLTFAQYSIFYHGALENQLCRGMMSSKGMWCEPVLQL